VKLGLVKSQHRLQDEWLLQDTEPNYIGRMVANGMRPHIDLWPDRKVSRSHALIVVKSHRAWIEDLNSKHGTLVNGIEIGKGRIELSPDSEIKVGDTILVLDPPCRHRVRVKDLVLEVDVAPALNYSLVHCGLPLVSKLTVRNRGNHRLSPFDLAMEIPGFADRVRLTMPNLEPQEHCRVMNPSFEFRVQALEELIESKLAHAIVTLDGKLVLKIDLQVLAHNEWSESDSHRQTLAAFVLPNHPLVRQLSIEARSKLRRLSRRKFDSFHSLLESKKKDAVELAVKSCYEYLRSGWDIEYRFEVPSFNPESQKIRTPDHLLSDVPGRKGAGTCVDLVLLLAACLEHLELQPLLLVEASQNSRHALLACWRKNEDGRSVFVEDKARILRDTIVVDCVGYSRGKRVAGGPPTNLRFSAASRRAKASLTKDRFLFALDVKAARNNGVLPLPFSGEPTYSDAVRNLVAQCEHTARLFLNNHCGMLHLMLALLRVENSLLQQALSAQTASNVIIKLEKNLRRQKVVQPDLKNAKATEHFKQAINSARALAKRAGSHLVLEEHLVRGFLDTPSDSVDAALRSVPIDRKKLLTRVMSLCASSGPEVTTYSVFSQFLPRTGGTT